MSANFKVSFVIPLYKGKKYLATIQMMINEIQLRSGEDIEVVFVNDCPFESITSENCVFSNINVRTLLVQNHDNLGIQRSRIVGIEKCSGEYVVMLDQDDILSPSYVCSQLKAIGDADAVVSNARHFNRLLYDDIRDMIKITDPEVYLKYNPIASPGQVMIKREAVSSQWMNNPLSNNGADDYYLWILMLHEKKTFALNKEILYLHHISGGNYSYNIDKMERSIDEMVDKLQILHVWSEKQCKRRRDSLLTTNKEKMLRDSLNMMIIREWIYLKQTEQYSFSYFEKNGINRIAVYGYGLLGSFLEVELKGEETEIEFFIDKYATQRTGVPVIRPDEIAYYSSGIDCVVVCVVYDYGKIKDNIINIDSGIRVVSLLEVLGNVVTALD